MNTDLPRTITPSEITTYHRDGVVFNSRIMHGGSGKLDEDQELRVFTTKWLGDDVRIKFRECGMDPDHSAIMIEQGPKPGDRPGTDLYPQIWPQIWPQG